MAQVVHVDKGDIAAASLDPLPLPPLDDGMVRLKVDSFAVTANNVTYAVIGDMFGYWNFFPAPSGKGIVPMWGHATVDESRVYGIEAGERVYGYLPMATHLDVRPGAIAPGQFTDMTDYRQAMSGFYNMYSRLDADPEHDAKREDARMLFGPLFKTGFLIESMFRRENWFGAEQLLITSASSKTSLALAHCAKQGSPEIRRIGITSPANLDFTLATGLYDDVVRYSMVDTIDEVASVSVDMAGNAAVLAAIHGHLRENLKYSCLVGATHIDARGGGEGGAMPGPAPILFFAPDHASASVAELGPKGFAEAVSASWREFVTLADGYASVDRRQGLQEAADAFVATVKGEAKPEIGIVILP